MQSIVKCGRFISCNVCTTKRVRHHYITTKCTNDRASSERRMITTPYQQRYLLSQYMNNRFTGTTFQHSTKKCCGVEPKDIIIFNSILPISIICYFIKVKKPLYNIWSPLWVSFHEAGINIEFIRPSPDPSVTAVYVAPVNRLFICCERMYLSWHGVAIIQMTERAVGVV
jgi:hypothetical protein